MVSFGEWLPWVEKNFGGTRQTATTYMRLAAEWVEVNGKPAFHLDPPKQVPADTSEPAPGESVEIVTGEVVDTTDVEPGATPEPVAKDLPSGNSRDRSEGQLRGLNWWC
jgi:hypothetical protein